MIFGDGGGEAAVAGGLADPSLPFAKREVMDANCGLLSLVLLPLLLLRRNAPAVSDGVRQNSIIAAKTNRHATGALSLFALRQRTLRPETPQSAKNWKAQIESMENKVGLSENVLQMEESKYKTG